jgi:hypothetical protein
MFITAASSTMTDGAGPRTTRAHHFANRVLLVGLERESSDLHGGAVCHVMRRDDSEVRPVRRYPRVVYLLGVPRAYDRTLSERR